jgi:hypothetical protein
VNRLFQQPASSSTVAKPQIDGQAKSHNIPREKVIRDVLMALSG